MTHEEEQEVLVTTRVTARLLDEHVQEFRRHAADEDIIRASVSKRFDEFESLLHPIAEERRLIRLFLKACAWFFGAIVTLIGLWKSIVHWRD